MIAFSSALDNSEFLQKGLQLVAAQEKSQIIIEEEQEKKLSASEALFNYLGDLMTSAVAQENADLEALLLEIVDQNQIVRRLPIGNTFVLTGLTLSQATALASLNRTALLTLSLFKQIHDSLPHLKLKKCKRDDDDYETLKQPFHDEPVTNVHPINILEKGKQTNVL